MRKSASKLEASFYFFSSSHYVNKPRCRATTDCIGHWNRQPLTTIVFEDPSVSKRVQINPGTAEWSWQGLGKKRGERGDKTLQRFWKTGGNMRDGAGERERDKWQSGRTAPCVPPRRPPEWLRAAGYSLRFVPRIRRCHISLTGQQASPLLHPSLTGMRIITQPDAAAENS